MNTIRIRNITVCTLLGAALVLSGCGKSETPAAKGPPSGPPGSIEGTVKDTYAVLARKVEARLLQTPEVGKVSEGGDMGVIQTESVRPVSEGPEMVTLQKQETTDYGKFKFDGVAPGKYLLSVGTYTSGIYREWVDVQPGQAIAREIKLPGRKVQQPPAGK